MPRPTLAIVPFYLGAARVSADDVGLELDHLLDLEPDRRCSACRGRSQDLASDEPRRNWRD